VRWGTTVVVLCCGLAVLAAGCGGGPAKRAQTPAKHVQRRSPSRTLSAYEVEMRPLGDKVAAELARAGRGVAQPDADRGSIERTLLSVQVELRAAAARLQRIEPPVRIRAQHRRLIRAVREFADELTGVIAGVRHGSQVPVYMQIPRLKGLKDMQRASDAITKAGYAIVAPRH
jgi:hypothetical protein